MNDEILIRQADAADVGTIAHHRASMCRDIDPEAAALYDEMYEEAVQWTAPRLESGAYRGWLAYPASSPGSVVGGAGILLRDMPPAVRGLPENPRVAKGRQALVINVYTERAWRHKGVARRLMERVVSEARSMGVVNIVLHAAPDGRHLYETLGFVATNEMRL